MLEARGGSELDGVLAAAHELKAPLAVLRQLALSLGELSVEDERLRGDMVRVSERAIKQVNDLAKIRRLEDGLFEMEPVAVRPVCDEVVNELKYLFREEGSEVQVRYSGRARLAVANRELLKSVIYNFVVNALHYAEEGSCSELSVRDAEGKVRVEVRDFGPALPTDVWREMRDGYVEKPTAIAMRPGSSGLGLYIASKFARYMRAEVGAVRHKDGTSFYVALPTSRQLSMLEVC